MPEAPAATPLLSTTRTSSPARARCQAVERPWTPAPITRCLADAGRVGGMFVLPSVAYRATALPPLLGQQLSAPVRRQASGGRATGRSPPDRDRAGAVAARVSRRRRRRGTRPCPRRRAAPRGRA